MPDGIGMTLADLTSWVKNLIANPQAVPAEHFFQTRVTRTPGVTGGLDPSMAGGFEPSTDPITTVQNSNLPDDVKKKLIHQWSGAGKGFIRVQPETRSDVMRHEQLHALQEKAGLGKYAEEIAARVDPAILTQLKTNPIYEKEMQTFGPDKALADEGTAFDLITFANRAGGSSRPLKEYISGILGAQPKEKRQFEKLTQ